MNILASQFNTKSLLKYVLPTILMMIFMSTYTIIDGLFVAHLIGEDALSAVNIVMPTLNLVMAIGLMFATGATAVMGKLMGQGKDFEARSFLSVVYLVAIAIGLVITMVFILFPEEIIGILGGKGDLFDYSKEYLIALSYFSIPFILQMFVQSFFVLAGKPTLGFLLCLLGGVTNMILDYVLISPNFMGLGIIGAGLATGIGNSVPAIAGGIYFLVNRKGSLYFAKPIWHGKTFFQSVFNGMSELVSQLSTAVTTLLFNIILLEIAGKSGVASISVILYIQMIQTALYLGYSVGVAPIISYKYGAGDTKQLQEVIKISVYFTAAVSILIISFSLLFDDFAIGIFISKESETFSMAKQGLRLFSIAYLFMGLNVFISSMFTALSNGKISAILSLSRTLVFLIGSLILLPMVLELNGVWLAVPLAELLAFGLALYFYKNKQKQYGY
ncbi:MATE family efflux transporter [Chakrabartyella piscis]|uniref:MATE family efflux transporter n=1 Tax=Chakrabartyella piscis TaxID=2918914 RepID=UPI0029585227|nr:MATE family efflux transporter [Chakrabartyella piscis]